MNILGLYLKNFRNYKEISLKFNKNLNVIWGENAQGKTNLLESIYLCSIGKSFKPVTEKEMIFFGEKFLDVRVDYFSCGREMYNTVRVYTEKKKSVTVNGVGLTKMSELVGNLNVVIFTPGELALIKEGPGMRRRFIDMLICQVKPGYMSILSSYNKIIEQKNKLLKEVQNKPSLEETLDVWDEQLSIYGAEIVFLRNKFLEQIMTIAKKYHLEISKEKEKISAVIKSSSKISGGNSKEEIQKMLLKSFHENRKREIFVSSTVVGPHRDDIEFYINGNLAKIFGSQGQQRTFVLALKLAQKDLFYEETGEQPVLLLDDITGELDVSRRNYLFSKITDSQVFITCTDTDLVPKSKNTSFFKVCDGKVILEGK